MPRQDSYTNLGEEPAAGDFWTMVDVSDTTDAPEGTTKRVTQADAVGGRLAKTGDVLTDARGTVEVVAGTKTVADADSGQILVYTGAGHTWTFNDAGLSDGAHGAIFNRGSGAITISTDGTERVTGTEPIPATAQATWMWENNNLWLSVNQ